MTGLKSNIRLTSKSLSWTLVREGGGWWQICCDATRPHSSFHHTITVHYWGNVFDQIQVWSLPCLDGQSLRHWCCWDLTDVILVKMPELLLEGWPTALTAVASCWQPDSCQQLWQLIQAVDSFQSLCKLLTALAAYTGCQQLKLAVTSCWQLSQLIQAVSSLTAIISCRQLWQLIQAVVSFDSL